MKEQYVRDPEFHVLALDSRNLKKRDSYHFTLKRFRKRQRSCTYSCFLNAEQEKKGQASIITRSGQKIHGGSAPGDHVSNCDSTRDCKL